MIYMVEDPDLSIIILNYNVKDLLLQCLESVFKNKSQNWQVIVVDNASSDNSVEAVKKKFPQVEIIKNQSNLGFAVGNNEGVRLAKAPVVFFLNPDTVIIKQAIQKTYDYLMGNPDIGAITCRVELPDGKLDYSCHRGFPTPWNSFCYFLGLAKIFPKWKIFSGYTATYLDIHKTHEIDCLTGAFLMVRKIAGQQIGWWDKDYFWNGEDIEFCYSLKQKGWKIYFFPEAKIIHYKGSSARKEKATISHGISAMRIFYKKHYYYQYPPILRDVVLWGVKFLEHYRRTKLWISQ
ncbi:TPA: glycosyl transferase family 2 [Candidatus Daviesbacteria bacterium]|uniref:Glycosyl transferase family 2 n=1 Tax=Candidatus Daviesbacteria bacterium GW2011_GWF2_38_6 TaxID=1618432 RepID=A0A0G0NNT9_9BACT|nr:MAG: Glycosyl transferase family 2 [Candidatus Daviesbacteria bacterium GW2011_GWA2_38_17]KKQ78746.1 MAG: Glycosyl transferase family 2 [Candidatus Daviesbacteria bacterium GW2011_GWF2_38_6]HBQ51203.1 glycosyl transferase family 2 [Candidatus Daviesbacteria bacterium]HCB22906.1 glycosyl transferase family 2 [Candidatus Daviesbacteria bacterium]